jgi:N-formylmaleamate deformylase
MKKLMLFVPALALLLPVAAPCQTSSPAAKPPGSAERPRSFSVQVVGQGKPMLLLPGLTCSGEVWNTTVGHFKDHYQCHVFTLAGFAGQPPIAAPMMATIRKELVSYIRERKLERPVIVGHSLGAFLAFWLAATDPDLAGPLVGVDGGTFLPAMFDPKATLESAKPAAEATLQMMAGETGDQFAAQNKMMLASMITDPKNVELIAPACAKSDPKAVAQAMYELMTTDLRDEVSRIRTPVLLIGSGGLIIPPETKETIMSRYEAQIARIPNHKVVLAEKARHFIMFDDPNFLFSTMEDFLKSSPSK